MVMIPRGPYGVGYSVGTQVRAAARFWRTSSRKGDATPGRPVLLSAD
jgi:hypothetical protein